MKLIKNFSLKNRKKKKRKYDIVCRKICAEKCRKKIKSFYFLAFSINLFGKKKRLAKRVLHSHKKKSAR